jgi:hypothetical protein
MADEDRVLWSSVMADVVYFIIPNNISICFINLYDDADSACKRLDLSLHTAIKFYDRLGLYLFQFFTLELKLHLQLGIRIGNTTA